MTYFGFTPVELGAAGMGIVVIALAGVAIGAAVSRRGTDVSSPTGADGDLVELDPPHLKTATWGLPQKLYRLHRQIRKRRKLANDGYVQWYLIDGTFPTPKFVKPERRGDGIPSYKHDGVRYLMPKDAMVASSQQGLWTIVHKAGEADPVNLRDPSQNAIPADTLEEYLQMGVVSSPPSWWDKFDMDASDVFKWGIVAFILIVVGRSVLTGGGMPV